MFIGGGVNPIFALTLALMLLFNVVGYAQTITCTSGLLCPPAGSDYLPDVTYQFEITSGLTGVTWSIDKSQEATVTTNNNTPNVVTIKWNKVVPRNGKLTTPSPIHTITATGTSGSNSVTKTLDISLCTFDIYDVTFPNNPNLIDNQEITIDLGFSGVVPLSASGDGFGKPGLTFTWSAPPGWTFPAGNTGTSTVTNITPCSEGNLKLTVSGCNGLQQTITIKVKRVELKQLLRPSTEFIICQGGTTTLTFQDPTTNKAVNVSRYEWEAVGGIKILQNGNQLNTAITTQPTIMVIGVGNSLTNGVGIIKVKSRNITCGNNSKIEEKLVWVGPPRAPTTNPSTNPYYPYYLPVGNSINIYANSAGGSVFNWAFGTTGVGVPPQGGSICNNNVCIVSFPGQIFAEIQAINATTTPQYMTLSSSNQCGVGGIGSFWVRTKNVSFKTFPNPADQSFELVFGNVDDLKDPGTPSSEQGYTVLLHDQQGTVVYSHDRLMGSQTTINTAKLPDGSYVLTVIDGDRKDEETIIVKHN